MARIRSLKPELWLSPQVMNLSHPGRLMFLGLITQADDSGRGLADTRRLKAAIFPGDDCTTVDVNSWLSECTDQALAALYEAAPHGKLFQLTGWHHQRIQKPQPSNYPPPIGWISEEYENGIVPVRERSLWRGEDRSGVEGNGSEGRTSVPIPDDVDVDAWNAWLNYREKIRKPLKPVSMPAALRKLAAFGSNQAAVVEQSIGAGWLGLFELKTADVSRGTKTKYAKSMEALDRA